MPSKELSGSRNRTLRLRKQFLDYFVNGTFIGDCVLSKDTPGAHVSSYTLPNSLLIIVINKEDKRSLTIESNLEPWLKSPSGKYKITEFVSGNRTKTTINNTSQWVHKTPEMNNLEIRIYELTPE